MLVHIALYPSLPASDIDRAIGWYRDKLGLEPAETGSDGGARYQSGDARWLLYPSAFAGTNQATAAMFEVGDFDAAVTELREAGVVFEEYDFDEFKTENGVLTLPDGSRAAWFKDSEGNILGMTDM